MANTTQRRHAVFEETDTDARFRALSNPTRRHLLRLIASNGLLVGDLAEQLGVSQPATSQHLKVLREAGLVTVNAAGRKRQYCADLVALRSIRDYFDDYWDDSLDRLKHAAENAQALLPVSELVTASPGKVDPGAPVDDVTVRDTASETEGSSS